MLSPDRCTAERPKKQFKSYESEREGVSYEQGVVWTMIVQKTSEDYVGAGQNRWEYEL